MLHPLLASLASLSNRRHARLALVGTALGALCACRDLQSLGAPPPDQPHRPQLVAPTPTPLPQDPLKTIAKHEDARSDGDGLVQVLLAKGEEATRARAATALGRMPYPDHRADVTDALSAALRDPSERVRGAAAFALGMRGDPSSASALLERWDDSSGEVRARIVEAASRVDDARLREKSLTALNDADVRVRIEAALAPHRWPAATTQPDPNTVDTALLALATSAKSGETSSGSTSDVRAVAWRALFTLARRKSEAARGAFELALASEDVHARIFAAQGLGAISAQPKSQALLRQALADADWRVVSEAALAIGKHPDEDDPGALAALFEHPSAHVRRVTCEALGNAKLDPLAVAELLERGMRDTSANVRAAALVARAAVCAPDILTEGQELHVQRAISEAKEAVRRDVELAAGSDDPLTRAGAATAAAHIPEVTSTTLLIRLCQDKDLRVAGVAIESLGKIGSAERRAHLRTLLAHDDNGIRLAALLALRESQVAEDLPLLKQCFTSSRGEISDEIAFNVLESAAKMPGDATDELLKLGLSHENAYVRRRARALWTAASRELPAVAPPRSATAKSGEPPDFQDDPRPRVEVRTSKGSLVFELFADETPAHVDNFLKLARANRYDRLTFHRVVPDFVIQGGDPRGDGNGGSAFDGGSVRAEFTPRKFVRGALGMPRNEDPDSGGGQIFVTHRDTPHLDGRYTLFGQLVDGADVLDAIEVGDKIVDVTVLRPGS
ncbi:MAG: HEAT repeat domain-containing protein [Planctomycetota bacterium]